VYINMGNTAVPVKNNISGMDSSMNIISYTPYVTSDKSGDDLKAYPAFSAGESYRVPAQSVVTLLGEIVDSDPGSGFNQNQYKLFPNYPNPFAENTTIDYYVPESGKIQISIYSVLGEQVKTMHKNEPNIGINSFMWDGTDNNNQIVSSGVYFVSLKSNSSCEIKKMIFIR